MYIRLFRATGRRRSIRVLTNPMNRLRNCDAHTCARIVASLLLWVAVAIVECQTAHAQVPEATASIVGCVSYHKGDPLPGATIAVKSIGFRRTVQTDTSGCYEMTKLTAGSYRVTVSLAAFDNVTRDDVKLTGGVVTRLDFTTRISPICECVRIGSTLRDQWAYAAAVFHVRILGPDRNHEQVMGRYRHAAQVVTILKGSSDAGNRTISLVQNQAGYTPEPYDPGQEFVMFLDSAEGGYGVLNDQPGLWSDKEKEPYPAVIFRVENGRIQSAPPGASRFVDASRDALFKELRALR